MEKRTSDKIGNAPILPLILSMSLPSMFSMLVSALYNVVDSIFVSRLGEYALTAVSVVYPIQLLNISVGVGAAIGLSSLISRRLGEKRIEEAQLAANHGLFLALCHWIIFLIFGIFFSRMFCAAFSSGDTAVENAGVAYCSIVCIGSLFIMCSCSFEKTLQANGNMIAPMIATVAGAVTNIILDPIMIFGYFGCPAFGVAGAAYATVIGQFVTFGINFYSMSHAKLDVRIEIKPIKINGHIIKDIYQVAIPTMVMQAIGSITTMAMNAILVTFSTTAVAVYGVYFKLQSFVFMPVFGMNHGLLPIMGYNFGARNKKRLLDALKYGILIAFCIMFAGMLIFKLIPGTLMAMFSAQGELLTVGIKCLTTISWCFPIAAVCIIIGTCFQATGYGINSMIVSIMRQLVVVVPVAFILSRIIGLMGIWWAFPIAEGISLLVTLFLFKKLYNKEIKNL